MSLVTPTDDEQFDVFCQQVTTSIAESYDLDPEDLIVNVGTPGHCDYGESVVQTALKTLEVIDKMDKRKILVVCAGMGLDTGFQNMLSDLQTYSGDYDKEALTLCLKDTERRYWALPKNSPKPEAVNKPYYRRYEKRPHR